LPTTVSDLTAAVRAVSAIQTAVEDQGKALQQLEAKVSAMQREINALKAGQETKPSRRRK
jgi:cell division protein FtsB